jgi:hypothetical protein
MSKRARGEAASNAALNAEPAKNPDLGRATVSHRTGVRIT